MDYELKKKIVDKYNVYITVCKDRLSGQFYYNIDKLSHKTICSLDNDNLFNNRNAAIKAAYEHAYNEFFASNPSTGELLQEPQDIIIVNQTAFDKVKRYFIEHGYDSLDIFNFTIELNEIFDINLFKYDK